MNKSFLLLLLFLIGGTSLRASETSTSENHDFSYRCSLYDALSLDQLAKDATPWKPLEGCCTEFVNGLTGANALLITAEGQPGAQWKGVATDFSQALNLATRPLVEFSLYIEPERPAREVYVRLLLSDGNRTYSCQTEVVPTLWRTVIFNIADCPFLSAIRHMEIALQNNTQEVWPSCRFTLDRIRAGKPLDLHFQIPGCSERFTAQGGTLSENGHALQFDFQSGGSITTTALRNSRNGIYNPPMQEYNTVFLVLANHSDATRGRLYYTTTLHDGDFSPEASKEFELIPQSDLTAYYINLSDTHYSNGQLTGLRLEVVDGKGGSWLIDRIDFLKEQPIESFAGDVTRCTATKGRLDIRGKIDADYIKRYPILEIYEAPLYQYGNGMRTVESISSGDEVTFAKRKSGDTDELKALHCLYKGPASTQFQIRSIVNKHSGGKISLLSMRLLAIVRDNAGHYVKVAPCFYVDNWRDFGKNPYAFKLPNRQFNVLDYGAKGDSFTDDTEAINQAITACNEAGGGQVVLPGNNSPYGRRFVATHVVMKSKVDLHIERGAVLWQSGERNDYQYNPYYGHDMDIPGVPWTHSMFVNYPLVEALGLEKIKITGGGTIRMRDNFTLNPDWSHYARVCTDLIHLVPLGICNCRDIELSDIDIVRSNNYHTSLHGDRNLYIGNVKMYELHCVSGDGLSFGQGTQHVRVNRAVLDSNDDGIVLCTSYRDPRGKICPWRVDNDTADHSVRDIKVEHSCLNSTHGAGKAVSIIPWGSTNPELEKQEMDNIEISDCMLIGGYSVGTWPDNPFDGKPFTNAEEDDYSPIKNFYIHDNQYNDPCDLLCVKPTNFRGDTGIHSASEIQNGNFKDASCYWTIEKKAGAQRGFGWVKSGGRLYEGLYLEAGTVQFVAKVQGRGKMWVRQADSGKIVAQKTVRETSWAEEQLSIQIPHTGDYLVGFDGKDLRVQQCRLVR